MWPKWPGFYTLAGSGASVSRAGVRTLARQVQRSSQPEAADRERTAAWQVPLRRETPPCPPHRPVHPDVMCGAEVLGRALFASPNGQAFEYVLNHF